MELNQLNNTCSMYELGQVYSENLNSLKVFNAEVDSLIEKFTDYDEDGDGEETEINPVKSIIYNSTLEPKDNAQLVKVGFKKVITYEGNNNRTVTTYIKVL